jgi:hypothetical protein
VTGNLTHIQLIYFGNNYWIISSLL